MVNTILRWALAAALLSLVLPLLSAKPKYPKTATCPVDAGTAKPTGKTQPTTAPECVSVQYKHKGTNYSDPHHPQRFQHLFWITICQDPASTNAAPSSK